MRPKCAIYTPTRDDEHPHPFHMRGPPSGSSISYVRLPNQSNNSPTDWVRLSSIDLSFGFVEIDYAGLNSYHCWCQQQNFGIISLTYFFPILARFFLYYMYSTCSLLEHEVILARGSGTRICLLEELFFLILFLIMSLTDHNFLSLRMSSKQGRTCSRVHDISARRMPLGIKTVLNLDTTNPSITNNT